MTKKELEALLRADFGVFLNRVFLELHPQGELQWNWHMDLLVDRLARVMTGEIRRLIITVPPRHLKSIIVSVAFVAWLLGKDPRKRVICASYGQDLADKHARDTRQIMSSDWYKDAFDTRISKGREAVFDFETTQQGGRMATSVGGVLTGRGGDLLIIDDPIKPDEALSKSQRESANQWYDHTLYTRLNDKLNGGIIIVMQRLHLEDLVGHVLQKEPWEVVNLPAMATEREEWRYSTLLGPTVKVRKVGELLHPSRESPATLAALRETLGEYAYSAQYQQSPVPFGGMIVKEIWIRYYGLNELPTSFDNVIQSWDTANKVSELSDYSVCTTWGIKGKYVYLLSVFRKRLAYPDLKREVREQARMHGAKVILIEDKASGTQLIQELTQDGLYGVKGIKPTTEKGMRLNAQTAMIENGFVLFPASAPWLKDFIAELTSFPSTKYDDQVDSVAQALAWISESAREPGMLVWIREQAETLRR